MKITGKPVEEKLLRERDKMEYLFNTLKINRKWVTQAVWTYVKDMIDDSPEGVYHYWKNGLDQLQIIVSPLGDSLNDPFVQAAIANGKKLSNGIPFGVTGKHEIRVFVNDTDDPRTFSQSFQVIIHELAHYLLWIKDSKTRVPLKYADTSGHKAGTILNWYTAKVHDLDAEGYDWRVIKTFRKGLFGKVQVLLSGINVTQALIDGPLRDRPIFS